MKCKNCGHILKKGIGWMHNIDGNVSLRCGDCGCNKPCEMEEFVDGPETKKQIINRLMEKNNPKIKKRYRIGYQTPDAQDDWWYEGRKRE